LCVLFASRSVFNRFRRVASAALLAAAALHARLGARPGARQSGYIVRREYSSFELKYRILLPGFDMTRNDCGEGKWREDVLYRDEKQAQNTALLNSIGVAEDEYAEGKTMLFIKNQKTIAMLNMRLKEKMIMIRSKAAVVVILQVVFAKFNLSKSGQLSADEMAHGMCELGIDISDPEFAAMMLVVDASGSGEVDFQSFHACALMLSAHLATADASDFSAHRTADVDVEEFVVCFEMFKAKTKNLKAHRTTLQTAASA